MRDRQLQDALGVLQSLVASGLSGLPLKGGDLSLDLTEDVGHPDEGRIWLAVNGEIRQDASLNELIWSVAESVAELSTLFEVVPGDLLYTGTPAGVGPLEAGDEVTGGIEGIDEIQITIR